MNLYVIVKDGKRKTYDHREWLYKHHLRFKKTGKYKGGWFITTTEQVKVDEIKLYCQKTGLVFTCYNQNQKRSTNYREVFYEQNTAVFDKYYFCGYCMLPYKKENITVDHIISIKKSRSSRLSIWLMKKMNITNINDCKNLVAACGHCNSKKGAKGGIWILRGFLGKSKLFITIYYILLFCWIGMVIYLVMRR